MKWPNGKILSGAAAVAMVGAIVAGLSVIGSPAHQRAERLDAQRLAALQSLTAAVATYWSQHDKLPTDLSATEANDDAIKDRVRDAPYAYLPGADDHYQLCAVFDAASVEWNASSANSHPATFSWRHPVGRYCFELTAKRGNYPWIVGANPYRVF